MTASSTSLTIAALAETAPLERRVALTPAMAEKYKQAGMTALIEKGAGLKAGFPDAAYKDAGAELVDDKTILEQADFLLCAAPPPPDSVVQMKKNARIAGLLSPHDADALKQAAANKNITLYALELLPRISRAQPMDVLSSQSNLAGYRAVIEGHVLLPQIMPMMMTAAGTIAAAKVLVLGAGVAGLQAIATAKRLGARVSASDVRAEVREQVESLGAKFLTVESEESGESAGGYAKTMSEDYQKKQRAMITEALKEQDLVICTALIPGRPAPELVSAEMVRVMHSGAVIMDMAASQGGNCALSKAGEVVEENGVVIAAPLDLVSGAAHDASSLLARNFHAFITHLINREEGDDEIANATLLPAAATTSSNPAPAPEQATAATPKKPAKKRASPKKQAEKK